MTMENENFEVPYGFARCLNERCPQAAECLRRVAALNGKDRYPVISIVNPLCYPAEGESCPQFLKARKTRVAWGVKKLFESLPYNEAVSLRRQLVAHFGKSKYYRFYREERGLSPQDQAFIRQLLQRKGIKAEPVFDRYTDEYAW